MLEAIQRGKLINKGGPQGEPLRVDQALGRHLAVAIEDTFELLLKFSMAVERSLWKMRRTSLPRSVWG